MKEIKTEIIINSKPEKVWDILTNFEKHPEWNPFIKFISGNKKVDDKIRRLVTIYAYLRLARSERRTGQAWRYVNSADKLLPLAVDEEDLCRCVDRSRDWDMMLPKDLKEKLDKKDDDIQKNFIKKNEKLNEELKNKTKTADECIKINNNTDTKD